MSWRILLIKVCHDLRWTISEPHGLDVVHTGDIDLWDADDEIILEQYVREFSFYQGKRTPRRETRDALP